MKRITIFITENLDSRIEKIYSKTGKLKRFLYAELLEKGVDIMEK